MAKQLNVTKGFVYQVEQGIRKPKDGDFGSWASAYVVAYTEMWKCIERIPMGLVGSFKEEPIATDPFSQLTEEEKSGLLPFLEYVRWRVVHQVKKNNASESVR